MYRDQNVRQNQNLNVGQKFFESVGKFIYLGTTLTNQNCMHEEIKRV